MPQHLEGTEGTPRASVRHDDEYHTPSSATRADRWDSNHAMHNAHLTAHYMTSPPDTQHEPGIQDEIGSHALVGPP